MTLDLVLLIASLLSIFAILSTRLAQRFGVPTLVVFVGIGMLAGSSGPGGVYFDNYQLSYNVGLLALAIILFSGGLDAKVSLFKSSLFAASLLATVGVTVKALVLGGFAFLLTPLDFMTSLVLGAVLAPTDAAAVFSVLRGKGLPDRLKGLLEAESGTNDPVSIYLTLALVSIISSGSFSLPQVFWGIIWQLVLGAIFGISLGFLLVSLLNRFKMINHGLYPVLALAGGLLIYALSNLLGGNGFLAIYLAGMVLGNRKTTNQQSIRTFMDSSAWGAQISMFLLLGLLVFPNQMLRQIPEGILMTLVLGLVARPLSILVTLLPLGLLANRYRYSWRELVLISWAGLKGAVPIILAIVPLLNQLPQSMDVFNIVFVVVIVGTALQGLTIVPLARALKLTQTEPPEPPLKLELGGFAPLDSAVLDLFLRSDSPIIGKTLAEIKLPASSVIAAIYRQGKLVTPRGSVRFQAEDHIFIITENEEADTNLLVSLFSSPQNKSAASQVGSIS